MTEPRIVTPQEAQSEHDYRSGEPTPDADALTFLAYAYTVATENERNEAKTRAAVAKALRDTADSLGRAGYPSSCYFMRARADAIENGADYE